MNAVFLAIVLVAFASAAWRELAWVPPETATAAPVAGPMQSLANAIVEAAANSVTLAIGLIGIMALFLGLMKVAEAGGMLLAIARTIRPVMVRLFPSVPAEHPAMGAMILNLSANVLGLGNAATPFGIRAMQELDTLNPHKGTATDAMVLFVVINTASVTLLPTGVIALRAAAGSHDAAGVLPTTLIATAFATAIAILAVKFLQKVAPVRVSSDAGEDVAATDRASVPPEDGPPPSAATELADTRAYPAWISAAVLLAIAALIPLTIAYGRALSAWLIPGLVVFLLGFGALRRVRVYEVFVEGARDGFQIAVRIIPYLVAILVAVAMFRASGAIDWTVGALGVWTERIGLPAEALTMAVLRSLSGSGAYGLLAAFLNDPKIGPDSYLGYLVSTIQGSTETTFYVLAVYFGAVQIRRMRHALAAGLIADVAGVVGAVAICSYLYGT
jgi:spore maturation protein SpmA/spore maturation protein SpmB